MLVLSRHRDERIVIGEGESQVVITVVDVRGDKVRLGIDAHRDTPVHRQEVYDAIQTERREARHRVHRIGNTVEEDKAEFKLKLSTEQKLHLMRGRLAKLRLELKDDISIHSMKCGVHRGLKCNCPIAELMND